MDLNVRGSEWNTIGTVLALRLCLCTNVVSGQWMVYALRPFDWRVFPPKLVQHADRLSDPLAENDVYEQEQSGLW